MSLDNEKARVHYWLDREYVPNAHDTFDRCVMKLQKQFSGIMRFRLEEYLNAYLAEREGNEQ